MTAPPKLILTDTGGRNFTPHEPGSFLAVCVDVIDYGIVKTEWKGKPRERRLFQFAFETNAEYREIETKEGVKLLVPQMIWSRRFTASLSEKAAVRAFLESWRGKPFTADELKGFDPECVVGVNAILNVIHKEQGGQTYANISSIVKPMKGMTWIEAAKKPDGSPLYIRKKDRPAQGDESAPEPSDDGYMEALANDDDLPF